MRRCAPAGCAGRRIRTRGIGGKATIVAAVALAERYLACALVREDVFGASADVRRYLHTASAAGARGVRALFLDAQHRLTRFRAVPGHGRPCDGASTEVLRRRSAERLR
jgi:DNA repair protein RadC